jgi:uncharacterized protein (DUF433 family)
MEQRRMSKTVDPISDRIVRDPDIMAGKPVIRGTRIPVERILGHLARCPDLDNLFAAYPRLTVADVQAALDYAHHALVDKRTRAGRPAKSMASTHRG